MLIKPEVNRFAKIKVIGVGGGGCNALNSMISFQQIQGVDFIGVNTDAQALMTCQAPDKVQIGENLTKGLGSGGDPDIGKKASEESAEKLESTINGADMVFITAGMGGGTGSGGSPIIADVARKTGALTVAVVTKPFGFEGARRRIVAEEAIDNLKDKVDTMIVIPNQRLLDVVDKKMSLLESFKVADSVLGQGVQGISDIIVLPGLINVDFADVRSIMTNAGSALMGIGYVTGGPDISMYEVDEAAKIISAAADADANIIFGAAIDESMMDQVKITVIATGFSEEKLRSTEARDAAASLPEIIEPASEEEDEYEV